MMQPTEPTHLERLHVVVMMGVNLGRAADLTGLARNIPAGDGLTKHGRDLVPEFVAAHCAWSAAQQCVTSRFVALTAVWAGIEVCHDASRW